MDWKIGWFVAFVEDFGEEIAPMSF